MSRRIYTRMSAYLFRDEVSSVTFKESLSLWIRCAVFIIFVYAIGFHLWGIQDPYVLAYETGFQEQIARKHIDPGLGLTRGISTISVLGPEANFHPTHPPLLQWILALLFVILGDRESIARLVPLVSQILILIGIWRISRWHLSPPARLATLFAAAIVPLSAYLGRIVNFEPLALAFIVWTIALIEDLRHSPERKTFVILLLVAAGGSLTDWPYQLFITCTFLLSLLHREMPPQIRLRIACTWGLCMAISILYIAIVLGLNAQASVLHHIYIQSGSYTPVQGRQLPPFLTSLRWWTVILWKLIKFGTPILVVGILIWIGRAIYTRRLLLGLNFWCLSLLVFIAFYFFIFSRAAFNHFWCFFYFVPLLAFCFGLIVQNLRSPVIFLLCILLALASFPISYEFRSRMPMMATVQVGQVIDQANHFMPPGRQKILSSPLLYVNRVDPLPYYANCETAFMSLSNTVLPHKFLVRYRPDFVALNGYPQDTSVTFRPQYPPELDERLQKSYSLTLNQFNTQLWESLTSPYLSIMGMLQHPDGSPAKTSLRTLGSVHVSSHFRQGEPGVRFNLWGVPKAGNRWLHGWVYSPGTINSKPFKIRLLSDRGREIGVLPVIPQFTEPQWQEFWIFLGTPPDELQLHWRGTNLFLGDWRLISETLWSDDQLQVLGSEIQRFQGSQGYEPVVRMPEQGRMIFPVMQMPGHGVDRVELPYIRAPYDPAFKVTFGLHPDSRNGSDGARFKVHMRDLALGTIQTILDTWLTPPGTDEPEWHTRVFHLFPHSRHVLQFTFEIDPGPNGKMTADMALWREARLVRREDLENEE